ncbi:MAG: lipopolysaccharide biosynthesis protein [Fermentimonas sp.]|nr:lipopolysaccharide biosynthesis protein [Fermentimonas sp.]
MTESSLKSKTILSLFWSFIDKFGQQMLNFVSMLILMNIVSAKEYGIIGSLAIFIAFSSILIDSGFGRALLNRQNLTDEDYSTVFIFNISLSLGLYLLLFISAPLLGELFHTPEIIPVSRILFISIVINAFGLIHQTILTKIADFKGLSKINLFSLLIADIVAVIMAINNLGVWALVSQTLLNAFFRTIFLWIYSRWRPKTRFSKKRLSAFFSFSSKLLASNTISTIANNIYPSLIAMYYPMNQVAYFNQAKKYQDIPFLTMSNTFRSVAMLILSEVNKDRERMKRIMSKLMKSISFISFPVGLIMIITAESLFFLFFKEKWLAAVPYFRVLTFAGMLSPFIFIFNELFIAKEKSTYFLGVEIIKAILLIILIIVLLPKGLMALAGSWVIYITLTLLISVILSGKLIGYTPLHFLKDILPYLTVALFCAVISYYITLNIQNSILYILSNAFLTGGLYISLCRILRLEMSEEIENWFSNLKKKKK